MGLFYFVFSWFSRRSHTITQLFIMTMFFLPGITFPFTTCYFQSKINSITWLQKLIHFICSVGIYFASTLLFSEFRFIHQVTAAILGAFFLLIVTKYLLIKNIPFKNIFIGSALGGLSFLPNIFFNTRVTLGFELFLWTVFIGYIINLEFRATNKGII